MSGHGKNKKSNKNSNSNNNNNNSSNSQQMSSPQSTSVTANTADLDALSQRVHAANEINKALSNELSSEKQLHGHNVNQLTLEKNEYKDLFEKKKTEMEQLQVKLEESESEVQHIKNQTLQFELQFKEQHEKYSKHLLDKNKEISDLTAQIENLAQSLIEIRKDNDETIKRLQQTKEENELKIQANEALTTSLEKYKSDFEQYQQSSTQLNSNMQQEQLTNALKEAHSKELNELKIELEQLQAQLEKSDSQALQSKILAEQWQNYGKEKDEEIVSVQQECEILKNKILTLENDPESVVFGYQEKKNQLENKIAQTSNLSATLSDQESQISHLNSEIQLSDSQTSLIIKQKEARIIELTEKNERIETRVNELKNQQVSTAFFINAQAREKRANDAIALLEKELENGFDGDTDRSTAIQTIVHHLREGLKNTDPQAYFDTNKADLRSQIRTLNHWKSIAVTAVNVILTVLAVCSVVGITALWLTGTLDNNLSKRGSIFAFNADDKQKAKRAFYEVEQSLSCKIGG